MLCSVMMPIFEKKINELVRVSKEKRRSMSFLFIQSAPLLLKFDCCCKPCVQVPYFIIIYRQNLKKKLTEKNQICSSSD